MNGLEQFSLQGKVIVITGATGILGEAWSLAVAKAGAKVVILGRNQERAQARVEAIQAAGGEAMAVTGDVLDEAQMKQAREEILNNWGKIDGLVNGAGGNMPGATIGPDDDLFEMSIEETRKAVDLNLFGTLIPTKVFGAAMADQGKGVIVNISSVTTTRPFTRVLGYTLAKTAIEGYTKWMAVELGLRYGGKLRINGLAPGVFLTEQNRTLLTNPDGSYTNRSQRIINTTPYSRLGSAEELTGTLIYLLSDASSFVNGDTIFVDGGFNAYSGV